MKDWQNLGIKRLAVGSFILTLDEHCRVLGLHKVDELAFHEFLSRAYNY